MDDWNFLSNFLNDFRFIINFYFIFEIILITVEIYLTKKKQNKSHKIIILLLLLFYSFDTDPTKRHTFWTLIVGGTIGWLATYGANQASVQRYSSLPTLKKAKMYVSKVLPVNVKF